MPLTTAHKALRSVRGSKLVSHPPSPIEEDPNSVPETLAPPEEVLDQAEASNFGLLGAARELEVSDNYSKDDLLSLLPSPRAPPSSRKVEAI
ncbi:hypothetical protein ACJRO7_019695 [Eucalyptus globulus]|uniref:Uncharacterized protein n=1 Tax=Eucalyptus globulus TaxID=34317 RepID=A0ABD3KFU9_EUCGL